MKRKKNSPPRSFFRAIEPRGVRSEQPRVKQRLVHRGQRGLGFFLLALQGGCPFWSGKPFYPQDICAALEAVPGPRLLVSTPFHLATLLDAEVPLPAVDLLLSATAPLSSALAARAEASCQAPLLEIYGSTESGQLASRRTTAGPAWELLSGVELEQAITELDAKIAECEQKVTR